MKTIDFWPLTIPVLFVFYGVVIGPWVGVVQPLTVYEWAVCGGLAMMGAMSLGVLLTMSIRWARGKISPKTGTN